MSEVEGLLALYGAIDRAVVAEAVRPDAISDLLGAYRFSQTAGWYDNQYLPWVEGAAARAERRRETVRRSPPVRRTVELVDREVTGSPVEEIHDAIGAFGPTPLEGRLAARRLLAMTVVARALPDHFGPGGARVDAVRNALTFRVPGEDVDDGTLAERARGLHEQFVAEFTSMDKWSSVVGDAVRLGLLDHSFLDQQDAPPCTGRLILRPTSNGQDPDPCLVMEAEFTTTKIQFAEAKDYLRPSNWTYDGSLWCRMEEYEKSTDSTTAKYHETVSTSCESKTPFWSASTDLQFWFSHPTPTEARAEYDLAPGLPVAGSDIEIDEGSLRILAIPGGVTVKTTKRVRFAGSFDGPGLAMFMCASGYSTVLEDVVFSVAKSSNPEPFPVPAPQGGTVSPKKASAATTPPAPGTDTWESLIGEAADFAESYAKDVAATCTSAMTKVQGGTYKVEDVWADGIKIWSSYLGGMGKAFDLGTRAAKVATTKSSDET